LNSLHEQLTKDSLPDWLGGNLPEMELKNNELIANLLTPERNEWHKKLNNT
jgi:hypothetical protein